MTTTKTIRTKRQAEGGSAALHRSLRKSANQPVRASDMLRALSASGLSARDARIAKTVANLRALPDHEAVDEAGLEKFVARDEALLIERAMSGGLVIPDFDIFANRISRMFASCRDHDEGEVASYIPQLARVDPSKFGLGVCTIDGQRLSLGDEHDRFCVQSTCKPISYILAHDLCGCDLLHSHVGREPSGRSFNELTLNEAGLPHNPMINAGAIMTTSLINPRDCLADRFDYVMGKWRALAGGEGAGFDNAVFLSEKATADRNFALAYFMRENNAFPADTDLMETLDFYFQCCSITLDVRQLSVVAATLANGGVCPITSQRVVGSEAVRNCLSLMYSCGMYDFSGEFAFTVGIPAKSGVSGALMLVIPGVCGIAVWSPRLDKCGNSVRGVRFAQMLSETYAFHSYATMVDGQALIDPTISRIKAQTDTASYLCAAAAMCDVSELRRLVAGGADVSQSDYDGRTALHLAASEGNEDAVRLLLAAGCEIAPRDRWNNTPLDDARREGKEAIVALLERGTPPARSKPAGKKEKAA